MTEHKDQPRCPKCSRGLIEHKGKYGEFFGCTGYPECTYTQNIDDYHTAGDYSWAKDGGE